jgi:hypothetical protein
VPEGYTIERVTTPEQTLHPILPSSSFARGGRPYLIITTEGKTHTGVMTRESIDAITLRTATLAEIQIPPHRDRRTAGKPDLDHSAGTGDAPQ